MARLSRAGPSPDLAYSSQSGQDHTDASVPCSPCSLEPPLPESIGVCRLHRTHEDRCARDRQHPSHTFPISHLCTEGGSEAARGAKGPRLLLDLLLAILHGPHPSIHPTQEVRPKDTGSPSPGIAKRIPSPLPYHISHFSAHVLQQRAPSF